MEGLVTRSSFNAVVAKLAAAPRLALDTETTGLRPYHGDKLFSIIIACSPTEAYYFNFFAYAEGPGADPENILTPAHIRLLQEKLFAHDRLYFLQNIKFDLAMLANEGCELAGTFHCTKAMGLIEWNEHQSYDLASSLERIGLKKDDKVEAYIEEHHLWEWRVVPGKKQRDKDKFFYKVPFEIIVPYGLDDGKGTFALGDFQVESLQRQNGKMLAENPSGASVLRVLENERKLTKTVFAMEQQGIVIDIQYCQRAAEREDSLLKESIAAFTQLTTKPYKSNSQPLFKEVFADDKPRWEYNEPTKTGQVNPSFESDILKKFHSPAAKEVLKIRDHESRWRFYMGFTYHSDRAGRIHPNFNQDGAGHGRFSSSNPNFQNLTSDTVQVCKACGHEHEEILTECEKCGSTDLLKKEWLVRQAIIPPLGFSILSIDYGAMEYRFMLEYACQQVGYLTPLAERVMNGEDFHQATADLASKATGRKITRKQAKTSNFLMLYGGGNQKLADQLGITLEEATLIRRGILTALPEVDILIRAVTRAAETRGYIRNWFGRVCQFPDPRWAYRGTNYLIAGGCADVVKIAMNEVHDFLKPYKSYMMMQVHDELNFYIADGEEFLIPQLKKIMENVYTGKYMRLVCSAYVSKTNLADLSEWSAA